MKKDLLQPLMTLAILLLMASPLKAQHYTPLNPNDPVKLKKDRVIYRGEEILLDSRHLLVDANLPEKYASPYAFRTFQDAAAHFTDGTEQEPMCVYIAPSVYWIDDPDDAEIKTGKDGREPFGMVIRCQHLHLIGLTQDACHVVLASQRGQTQGAIGNFTMFDFWGDGLQVRNMTLGNFCNVDLEYPLQPALSRPKRNPAITQAHVAYAHGDRIIAENVRFISRLNMNPLNGARRILFKDCRMECTDDALTGNGVYWHCDLHFYANKPFWRSDLCGAVFLDCDFTIEHEGPQFFCKSPGPITLIDCRYHGGDRTLTPGWSPAGLDIPHWLRCYTYNVSREGEPCPVYNAECPECTVELDGKSLLQAFKTAKGYNLYNLLRGNDGWNPTQSYTDEVQPTCLQLDRHEATVETGKEEIILTAQAFQHANYPAPAPTVSWRIADGGERFIRITPEGNQCHVSSIHEEDTVPTIRIIASTPEGLEACASIQARPRVLPAPAFRDAPTILEGNNGLLRVTYRLGSPYNDESRICWYRCSDSQGGEAIPVQVTHANRPDVFKAQPEERPECSYIVSTADTGYYLMAEVTPKDSRSETGTPIRVVTTQPIANQSEQEKRLELHPELFPTSIQPRILPGFWTVDGYKPLDTQEYNWQIEPEQPYWVFGKGYNGAKGYGLLQERKGARLLYTPTAETYRSMKVELQVDPTKTAGQGFGSATGQYMDVYIKLDTRTLTGYALRIIRTTKYANAVDFLLVRYDQGTVTPVSEAISATCYRTGCTIRLAAQCEGENCRLTAHVETATPLSQPTDPNLHTTVDLQAEVPANTFGGTGIQHTGSSGGESTTMIHGLTVEWE